MTQLNKFYTKTIIKLNESDQVEIGFDGDGNCKVTNNFGGSWADMEYAIRSHLEGKFYFNTVTEEILRWGLAMLEGYPTC